MGEFGRRAMFDIMRALPGGTMISNDRVIRNVNTVYEQEAQLSVKQKSNINMENEQKEKKKDEIVLPTAPRKAPLTNPSTMVISGKHKEGKTSAVIELPNHLLLDVENGAGFVDGTVMAPPSNYGPVSKYRWLRDVAKKIREEGKPYDFVIIDTLSQLDMDAELVGTFNYMNSVIGKSFNRQVDKEGKLIYDTNGKTIILKPDDPNYQSVITLPNGGGYYYTRTAILDLFDDLKDLGKICTIFICHVADKMISEKQGEQVIVKDLALTGKVQSIIPRLVDAIGTVWNEDGQLMISFVGKNEKIGGVRAKHLLGYNGPLNWSSIFIKTEE